jgi:hypothetical protein
MVLLEPRAGLGQMLGCPDIRTFMTLYWDNGDQVRK